MTTNHKPATALPTLAHINGESNPFTVLGAIVPSGAPMRALLQIQDERTQLVSGPASIQLSRYGDVYQERISQWARNSALEFSECLETSSSPTAQTRGTLTQLTKSSFVALDHLLEV